MTLRVRWLGRVPYREAWALQRALHEHSPDDHLLLLEHPHVYTLGVRADLGHVLVPPAEVGADLVRTDRGGDVTYHGPGQLVGYPIVSLPAKRGGGRHGMADTVGYVRSVEQLVVDALADVGLPGAGRLRGYPGVWVDPEGDDPRKIAAIGVRLTRGRSMHGFALNVDPDMDYWGHIVPCGIPDKRVTSLAEEGVAATLQDVTDAVAARAAALWGAGGVDRRDVVWRHRPDDLSAFSRGEGPGRASLGLRPDRRRRRRGAPQGPAGPGRCDRGAGDRGPQARLAAVVGTHRPRIPAAQAHDPRPRPRHGLRGGRLSQHLRVLGRRDRHLHDQRRAVHPGLRVLPRRHPASRAGRPRRAGAGGGGGRADGPRLRGAHRRCPRRPPRRRGRSGSRPRSGPSAGGPRASRSRC